MQLASHPVEFVTGWFYFRTSKRLFVLKFPGGTHRIFHLRLPANPMKAKYRAWSEWQNPDFVAKAGEQPASPSGGNDYQIRYKLDYQADRRGIRLRLAQLA